MTDLEYPGPKIALAAMRALEGKIPVEHAPGYCLKFTRQVVEAALEKPAGWFYSLIEEKCLPAHAGWWARDAEHGLRRHGWQVPTDQAQLLPGDLLFRYDVSFPFGHVAPYLGAGFVAENTDARRGHRYGGALALTSLKDWGRPTTAIRLPAGVERMS